jgi:uncharacterized membrane protein YdfJ with MMPL/SSD domain
VIFSRLAGFAVRRAPFVVAASLAVAALLTLLVPPLAEIGTDQGVKFLPEGTPSREAQKVLRRAFPNDPSTDPAVLVLRRRSGLTDADRAYLRQLAGFLVSPGASQHVKEVQSAETSPQLAPVLQATDGRAELVLVTLQASPFTSASARAIDFLRRHLSATAPPGLDHQVTGLSALTSDQTDSMLGSFQGTAGAAVALVLIILILVYRSPVAPFLSLISIGIVFLTARGLVALMAQRGVHIVGFAETFMLLWAFGAGTDYNLFVISRYREELASAHEESQGDLRPPDLHLSLRRAGTAVGPVVTASAATVTLGFLAFFAAKTETWRGAAPAYVTALCLTLPAALILTPALLRLAGKMAFWPTRIDQAKTLGRWSRLADLVERRPMAVLGTGLVLLVLPSLGLMAQRQSLDLVKELPAAAESHRGFEVLSEHYPGGALSPLYLVVNSQRSLVDDGAMTALDRLTDVLRTEPRVAEVRSVTQPAGAPLTAQKLAELVGGRLDFEAMGIDPKRVDIAALQRALASPQGLRLGAGLLTASPAVRERVGFFLSADGHTARLVISLTGNPYERDSVEVTRTLDDRAAAVLAGSSLAGSRLILGGPGAFQADFQDTANRDFRTVAPLELAAVLVILVLLLRSSLAPLYLLAGVLLSFTATMGITVAVFQGLLGSSGVSFWLPTTLFIILVALGADYNIFITGRIREELDRGSAPADAIRNGLLLTGRTITSAGLILAGTFAILLLTPIPWLAQLGFAVALGVLLDTFVVRTLLVPATAMLLGSYAFWPSGAPTRHPQRRRLTVVLSGAGIAVVVAALIGVAATRSAPQAFVRVPAAAPASMPPGGFSSPTSPTRPPCAPADGTTANLRGREVEPSNGSCVPSRESD